MSAGSRAQNYSLAFTEPFLFDRNITGGFNLFKADVRSAAGAVGLLQLLPATARRAAVVLGRPALRDEQLLDGIRVVDQQDPIGAHPRLHEVAVLPRAGLVEAELIAPEIEVRDPRRTGVFMISLATASADSGPSITRQGIMIFWSLDADHSK